MRIASRVLTIAFSALTGFFFIYQLVQGNPFHDAVHPALVSGLVFAMGIAGVVFSFRFRK